MERRVNGIRRVTVSVKVGQIAQSTKFKVGMHKVRRKRVSGTVFKRSILVLCGLP